MPAGEPQERLHDLQVVMPSHPPSPSMLDATFPAENGCVSYTMVESFKPPWVEPYFALSAFLLASNARRRFFTGADNMPEDNMTSSRPLLMSP